MQILTSLFGGECEELLAHSKYGQFVFPSESQVTGGLEFPTRPSRL